MMYHNFEDEEGEDGLDDLVEIECVLCGSGDSLIHESCQELVELCHCPLSELEIESMYKCEYCNIRFDPVNESIQDLNDDESVVHDLSESLMGVNMPVQQSLLSNDNSHYWNPTSGIPIKQCNHKHDEVILADGTPIYCSSVHGSYDDEITPDFGLYADRIWNPTWRNEFINWPDMNIPKDHKTSLVQIEEAYLRAFNEDQFVEIGCIGGHGRTGVILGCMYLLSAEGEKTAEEAIEFVHVKYCKKAIETDLQEWFLHWAAHVWFEHELPALPKEKNYTTANGACTVKQHYAMIMRGHKHCLSNDDCYFWKKDVENFNKNPLAVDLENALTVMEEYPLWFDGIPLANDECPPIYHYAMIVNGHSNCALQDECKHWDEDYEEFITVGSINGMKTWDTDEVKSLVDACPAIEDWNKNGTDPF